MSMSVISNYSNRVERGSDSLQYAVLCFSRLDDMQIGKKYIIA